MVKLPNGNFEKKPFLDRYYNGFYGSVGENRFFLLVMYRKLLFFVIQIYFKKYGLLYNNISL